MQVGHQRRQDGGLDHPELRAPLLPCSAGHHLRLQVSRLTSVLTVTACIAHLAAALRTQARHDGRACWH